MFAGGRAAFSSTQPYPCCAMASRSRKKLSSDASRPRPITAPGSKKRLVKLGDAQAAIKSEKNNKNGKNAAAAAIAAAAAAAAAAASASAAADHGARIAEAVEADIGNDEVIDGHVYKDPAPLKWGIFEAVAKTNGQR